MSATIQPSPLAPEYHPRFTMYTCHSKQFSIYLLMDTYVASISWQLQITFLWSLGCMYLFELVVFLRYISRGGIAGSCNSSIFPFFSFLRKKCFILLSTMTVLIYIPTNSVWGFLFLHILTNIFYNSHSDRCEAIAHCGLALHFPDD